MTGPEAGPPVEVSAVAEGRHARVRFRRTRYGSGGNLARLAASGGELVEVVYSPDRLSVCALWRDRRGRLECRFAYGGQAMLDADSALDEARIEYVFLERGGCSITAVVPRANPMRPVLPLRVELEPSRLPATLRASGREPVFLEAERSEVPFALPADDAGVLVEGDLEVEILTSDGARFSTLIGVDADGTPVAASGFVRDAGS